VILLDERTGERIVLWDRDDRLRLKPDDVRADSLTPTRLLHVDDVDAEAAIAAAALARLAGIPVTSDIEQVTPLTAVLVAAVDVPIFAESVPAALTGEADMERALRAIRKGHSGLLCVTLGSRGAMLLEGDVLHRVSGLEVSVADTTGAGDVFRGAFIHALLRGDAPAGILRFANTAAALSCTKVGAIAGIPTLAEVEGEIRK
jgi:sugar/nucleoside kinase (ribokinase family)